MSNIRVRSKLTLTPVTNFLASHPEFRNRDANHAICWKDAITQDEYLVDPRDVDLDGWCDTFYHRYPEPKRFPEHPLVGLHLASRADEITEVEPGLFRLRFS